ncbi:MAG: 50S ribosomal protein L11 methyltransferase [Flavisolibacter sp.]
MNSIQVSIAADEEHQEILISQLSELGSEGFEQTDDYLLAYFNEFTFKSYEINELLKGYSFVVNTMKEQNWNEVWESNFSPVVVDSFCAIRAEFHEPITGMEHEIIITPKMSFGTGHHATTYMMIEQMSAIDFKNKSVFDFGTGTGILAILAEKLDSSSVTAIDVDEWSIANAQENLERNLCSKVSVSLSSEIPNMKFDIILANINRNVILSHLSQLNKDLDPKGGYLLLSGLLTSDRVDIVGACTELGLSLVKQTERNNWISLLLIKAL